MENLEKKFFFNEKDIVNVYGSRANIYKTIEPGKVAKIMKKRFSRDFSIDSLFDEDWYNNKEYNKKANKKMRKLENEVIMGKKAKEFGLNVPNVNGVYLIRNNDSGRSFPGLSIDFLDGQTVSKMTYDLKNKDVENKWKEEIKKAEKNFIIGDPTDRDNAIYVPKEDKVYLIDFSDWKLK